MKRLGKRLSWVMAGARAAQEGSVRESFGAPSAPRGSGPADVPRRKFTERVPPEDTGDCSRWTQSGTDSSRIGGKFATHARRRATTEPRGHNMDMGIAGRTALVCAASKGLGRGCAEALAAEGVNLTIVARTAETLEATAAEIRRQSGVQVTTVACDITTPEGRAAALAACPQPDILVNNAGGPPPGDFRNWGRAAWIRALDANMLTPIELIKATIDGMIARKFGRIVNITSGAVKAPIEFLGLSNGARSGLTGFVAGLARSVARHNVTINNLLPGQFETDRMRLTMEARAKAT